MYVYMHACENRKGFVIRNCLIIMEIKKSEIRIFVVSKLGNLKSQLLVLRPDSQKNWSYKLQCEIQPKSRKIHMPL